MRLIWMAAAALLVAAVPGCSGEQTPDAAVTSSAAPVPAAAETASARPVEAAEPGVRVAVGETRPVVVPADVVMDIRAPAAWGDALPGLRCTVTDGGGRNEDLRSSDLKKREQIAGVEWVTLWTFSSAPGTEVTVGCKDQGAKIPGDGPHQILVSPRGVVTAVPN